MELLTTAEIAKMLRVSEAWVWKHAARKARPYLPCIPLLGSRKTTYRFVKEDVEVWIKKLQDDFIAEQEHQAKLKEKALNARLGIR
jgi:hypothetical protein